MLRKHASLLLVSALCPLLTLLAEEAAKAMPEKAADYPELVTTKGEIFRQVAVTRVEADALLVRHEGGMARISLFDLSPELQARYDFDPVAALKRYRENLATQRELRKTALLEAEKRHAAAIRIEAARERLEVAKAEWIPVEATVILIREEGALLSAKRIEMVPTRVRSTLGFLNEGPPERTLVAFSTGPVLLMDPPEGLRAGQKWRGYLNPVTERFVIDRATGLPTVPAHRGASAAP